MNKAKVLTMTALTPVPWWLIVNATRYATGRISYAVSETVTWLVANWDTLPPEARAQIARDLTNAFTRDDLARSRGLANPPLGMECDRRDWERVMALCIRDGLTAYAFPVVNA